MRHLTDRRPERPRDEAPVHIGAARSGGLVSARTVFELETLRGRPYGRASLLAVTQPPADSPPGTVQSSGTGQPRPSLPVLYALGFLAFFMFGLVQAGYGPAYPNLGREYAQPLATVGITSSLHFVGSAVGTVLLGVFLTRLSLRSSLMLGGVTLLLGLLGVAFAPAWALVLVGAVVGGLGYGTLSAGFNLAFAQLGPGPSNLVNGLFGVGSVVSPLLVTLLARGSHAPPFVLMGVMAALLALGIRLLWPRPADPLEAGAETAATEPSHRTLPAAPGSRRPLALFGLCFFLYVGIEAGLGNWATTYFLRQGAAQAALLTSFYWLALTLGRFVFAALGSRFTPMSVLIFATGGAMLGCGLMLLGGPGPVPGTLLPDGLISSAPLPTWLAPAGLILAGFCIAPVFSSQLAWFARTQPPRLLPYMLTLGGVGGALLPALTGLALPRLGVTSVPLAPLIIAALLLGSALLLNWTLRRQSLLRHTR